MLVVKWLDASMDERVINCALSLVITLYISIHIQTTSIILLREGAGVLIIIILFIMHYATEFYSLF